VTGNASTGTTPLQARLDERLCHTLVAEALMHVNHELVEVRTAQFLAAHPWAPGKRLRPITFLLSNLCMRLHKGGDMRINGRESRLACAIELFHEASLVHDDLVDRAQLRRGTPTIQMSSGEGMALLVGDYLLFRGLKLVLDAAEGADDIRLARELADTGLNVAKGEAEQLDRYLRRLHDPERLQMKTYIDLIAKKTAGLFAACAEAGAAMEGADEAMRLQFRDFGMNLGIAFQMIDDVMDVAGDAAAAQKTLRSNLGEGTVTLPMIHVLTVAPQHAPLLTVGQAPDPESAAYREFSELLQHPDTLAACANSIEHYAAQARAALAPAPLNIYRVGLEDLLDYVCDCPWGGAPLSAVRGGVTQPPAKAPRAPRRRSH
jgi:octaprenyl-diphosphate synthase